MSAHSEIKITSNGGGNFSIPETSSTGKDVKVILNEGDLESLIVSQSSEPFNIHNDGTVIFNGREDDIDFTIKASKGKNGNTRFDVTAACPTK